MTMTNPNSPPIAENFYAGIDVGGTSIKLGLVDEKANSLAYQSISTEQEKGPENAAKQTVLALESMMEKEGLDRGKLAGAGLATPGPMDIPGGKLHCPGNLPAWHNVPIKKIFSDALGMPVEFDNDANAAAYGEYWAGAGQKLNSMVMFTLGTGVGGGIVTKDKRGAVHVLQGAHSCGGELGHIIIDSSEEAPLSSLGTRGTLEGYCGSYGVVGQAKRILADQYTETALRDSIAEGEKLSPLLIANTAEAGDKVAKQIILDTARYLALGIASTILTIDPEGVVIGGNLTFGGAGHPLGEEFMAEVRKHTYERIFPNLRDKVTIEFAQLAGKAGYIGAAGLACRPV